MIERILALVAEQTGYPADMLDLELDLEADLGIDTVKQAEVFAAIREAYGIERDDNLKLRDYPTLNHVVGFVRERAGGAGPPGAPGEEAATGRRGGGAPAAEAAPADGAFPRRVPVPVVRPPLDRCAPTGVELGAGSRVVLMPDRGGVGAALAKRLEKRGVEVLEIEDAPGAEELEGRLAEWTAAGPVQGVYWLPALDDEGPLSSLDPAGVARGAARAGEAARDDDARARRAGRRARHVPRLGDPARGPPRLRRGGSDVGDGGRRRGFTKALTRERERGAGQGGRLPAQPQDGRARRPAGRGDAARPGRGRGRPRARSCAGRSGSPSGRREPDPARELGSQTTFLVTGAAGSIVSAITADLAAASGGTFHLLDLVPEPDPADPDLAALRLRPRAAQARPRRANQGARRARDPDARRARAGADRAGARRRWPRSRRFAARAARRTGTRST